MSRSPQIILFHFAERCVCHDALLDTDILGSCGEENQAQVNAEAFLFGKNCVILCATFRGGKND
jgi:hypothetical protein